jgi:hypothetical protein
MQGELLLVLVCQLLLTGLPGIAAALLAARAGVRSVPVLLGIGLAATGVLAMLGFWAYYGDRQIGETFSYLVLFGSVLAIVWTLWERRIDPLLSRQLATPLALWALGSLFVVFLGFAHGGTETPVVTSLTRFTSGSLPSDSGIPNFYAEWFYEHGHAGTPPVFPGEWLVSDRPPLQIGYALSQRPFSWGTWELHYQVLGVVLQQLWIVGLWALLLASGVGRRTRALIAVAVLVSPLAILNAFFVWPKLLPAAMLLAAAALVMTPLWTELRRNLWAAVLVAGLCGVAMLGHGSSVFGIVPLALVAVWRGLPSWRWLGVGALVGIALMAPWSAFQKYDSPPGNRLTKWMLASADITEIDDRGTLEAIVDSYREAGVGDVLHYKAQNFVTMAGGGPAVGFLDDAATAVGDGDLELADKNVRNFFFFYFLPGLALLLVGPLAMAVGWRRGRERQPEWAFALTCLLVTLVGCVAWGLLLFGSLPSRTVIHAGTYLLPILAMVGAVAGLRATFPRFAYWLVGANCLLTLVIFTPSFEPPEGSGGYSPIAFLLAAAGLAGFGWLALRREQTELAVAEGSVGALRPDEGGQAG